MKYFHPSKTNIPYCHDFYKGKYDDYDHEKNLNLSECVYFDDYMLEDTLLHKAFKACLQDYDYYGITEVRPHEWTAIHEYAKTHLEPIAVEALNEIDYWVQEAFETEGLFTIRGV